MKALARSANSSLLAEQLAFISKQIDRMEPDAPLNREIDCLAKAILHVDVAAALLAEASKHSLREALQAETQRETLIRQFQESIDARVCGRIGAGK